MVVLGTVLSSALVALLGVQASSAAYPEGAVTGRISPCVGLATKAQYAKIPVTVELVRGSKVVAYEKSRGMSRYRFRAPAGTYVLETGVNGLPTASVIRDRQVELRAGRTVHLNLVPACK